MGISKYENAAAVDDALDKGVEAWSRAVINNASDIVYDNATSGLNAKNVQNAIDEINSQVYTKSQTDEAITNKVAEIVAEAPEDFDTLKEMSDWISSHEESASAMNTAIAGKIPIPQTASVGQVLIVKAVDGNGKPSEWETVNMGSRYTMTLDSDTATLNITTLDGDS